MGMRWPLTLLLPVLAPVPVLAQGLWRGPFLNDVTSDAVTVVWETPTLTTATLRYGLLDPPEIVIDVTAPATHHAVRLTGLLALTGGAGQEVRYELEVTGEAQPRGGVFSTAVDGGTPFAFVVYGDNRSNAIQHEAVVAAIMSEPTPFRFVVSSGDMVSDGQVEADWDQFFEIEAPLLADYPIYSAIGNHEVDDGHWGVTRRIFELPTDQPPASGEESYYQFIYGNAQIIVINIEVDGLYRIGPIVWGPQEVWLREVLNNPIAGVEHRFLIVHQGPYSSKPGRSGNLLLRLWLDELLDEGVTAVISGHDHYAERGWAGNGLPYAIHGGGGAPLYDTLGPRVTPDHTVVYSESTLGYLLIEVDGPLAQIWTKGLDGGVVDYFAYGDPITPECTTAADCTVPPVYACPGGSFECLHRACAWANCETGVASLLACVPIIADDCAADLAGSCAGTARCVGDVPYAYCECPDAPVGDCATTADCSGRPPPVPGCAGTYVCVDLACEFVPDDGICATPDPDGGPMGEDGGPIPGDPGAGDAASAGDPASGGDDRGVATGDPTVALGDSYLAGGDVDVDSTPGDRDGPTAVPGGCGCSGAGAPGSFLWLLLLAWRRSRSPTA